MGTGYAQCRGAESQYHQKECEERKHDQCQPSMVRFGDAESIARIYKLTRDSIQEALRMYLQPIKLVKYQERRPTTRLLHHVQTRGDIWSTTLNACRSTTN